MKYQGEFVDLYFVIIPPQLLKKSFIFPLWLDPCNT